ncbi:glycoside hydrolase domain-containing protein [Mucilaginibacter sp. BT774]|uniref:glycoside hydrolase domain-containing protein n=1 Tax=Mucilaginibacter sp. BT774 TaxID=3062276 RepID=UPI0026760525|nr:glycoside hydrolase domain-containing protein [Mucilaginibacter sp. BT774]MDO3629040.1 DUF6067 family protein [Mucilaginibacter sp. BT774]
MMRKTYVLLTTCLLMLTAGISKAQTVPYKTGNKTWDPDKLGNQRAVVTVTGEGKVAEVVVPWRCRTVKPDQLIIVVDAKTGQQIANVKTKNVGPEEGTVDFEPVSGMGNYYIYFLPYDLKQSLNYPNAVYRKGNSTASDEWLKLVDGVKAGAKIDYFESYNSLNNLYPMEVIATKAETEKLISNASQQPYLIFPENRIYPISMDTSLPQRWVVKTSESSFSDTAARGENFSYQLGIYAFAKNLNDIKISFSDLKGQGGVIPASAMSCLNTDGITAEGKTFKKTVDVEQGHIQAMWCLVNIPAGIKSGKYTGTATITVAGLPSREVKITLNIGDRVLNDKGISEPWKQTRLAWLNSTMAQQNVVIKPYLPLKVEGNTISLLGRKLTLGQNGFPSQINTYFTEEMTSIGTTPNHVLAQPFQFNVKDKVGNIEKWKAGQLKIKQTEPGTVTWTSTSSNKDVSLSVSARVEFDGFINYQIKVTALNNADLNDIQMVIPFSKQASEYMMGLNEKGSKRPDNYEWHWDVAHKNQDGAWIGNVNAGLQFSLRDDKYIRPLNTNFYLSKPLVLPTSWGNDGKGGINISSNAGGASVTNYSGGRSMKKGEVLYYNFTLMITPFHPINTEQQWDMRFYHKYSPIDSIKQTGATVINIHHGTAINPYINYPFIAWQKMKNYIDSAHQTGLKVKIYNTVRELSNSAYEIQPMRSLGHEIFSPGKGGGYSWLQEHLGGDYIAAWYVPEQKDAAIINSGVNRWHNYYVEGMNWLVNNVGIDGIYLDDVAFDRTTMKRVKRVLTQNGHPGIIDLHSANQYNKSDGFNNSANLYLEHFPYLNRLWFGEYFDYEKNDPNFFLVEVSGIPYGLMGEMLQGGGNPWRGIVYGMTNRMPWSDHADPRPIWKAWDDFGIKSSRMIGYWVSHNPVKTNNKDVLATAYVKDKKVMIAIASWAGDDTKFKLNIDWKALGIDPTKAKLAAPEITNFQAGSQFSPNEEIPVSKGKGWLLILK